MMRSHFGATMVASAALLAAPLSAQDHSHEEGVDHSQHGTSEPAGSEAIDHSKHAPDQTAQSTAMDDAAHEHGSHPQHSPVERPRSDRGAMDHPSMDHATMDHGPAQSGHGDHASMEIPSGPPPSRAFEGPQHAADLHFDPQRMAAARAYNRATHGDMVTGMVLAERLEARVSDGADAYLWDISGWYGTATNKIVFKSEGEGEFGKGGELEDAEAQLLWGHAIGPFVDLQAGVRLDLEPDTRAHLAVGAAGLAPYMIHFDAALFLSDAGDLTARIEAEHDMRLTQRLILQPRVEAELSAQDIPERSTGSGLSKIELGARLRYEIVPEFAPYIGVEYEATTGRTADYLRLEGKDPDGVRAIVGVRFWF